MASAGGQAFFRSSTEPTERSPLVGEGPKEKERPKDWKEARDQGWKPPVYTDEQTRRAVQKDFLFKVYGILAMQLAVTVAFCALFMLVPAVTGFALENQLPIVLITIIPTFAIIFALMWLKNKHPWNGILLVVFTLCQSVLIGTICAIYQDRNMGQAVAVAWVLTLFVFVALTVFVWVSDVDFSFLGFFLPIALLILILWSFTALLFGFKLGWFYGAIGSLVFSAYILYDTDQIMKHMGCDEHIIAAIELYLDVLNLFLMLMAIFGGRD
mmetsp:Transcript_48873/g.122132  ORF Transcript_48873/g.122132 Transcript_48873/m.122132 type:complete len:269 (+) Transcript_48873:31-837(+)